MRSTKSIGRLFLVITPWLIAASAVYLVYQDYQLRATQEKIAEERAVEDRAVTEIQKLGGFARYGGPPEFWVKWVRFIATGELINGKTVLTEPEITDEGLVHLRVLTRLQNLNLDGTKVTDVGLEHLKGLVSLETLNVRHTQVTSKGVSMLQQALPNCEILH